MPRFAVVLRVLSGIVLMFGVAMFAPLGVAIAFADGAQEAYGGAIAVTLGFGAVGWFFTRQARGDLQIRDGFLLVVVVWTLLPAFASLPLMISLPELSVAEAYFEAMSAITTTGATVLVGLDHLPLSLNLWRHLLEWLGGMGIIVLTLAILPLLGVGGSQLYKAETPGPMKDTKLTPRITETAKGLWLVYSTITVACLLAYRLAGMGWFDAVTHAFSTVGLGGFSTHDASFGHFDSVAIERVAIVFMLIAGINFGSHFLAARRLSITPYRRDAEAPPYLFLVTISVFALAGYLVLQGTYSDYSSALRYAAFNVVSIATTTGYANTDYNLWPAFAPLWMLFLGSFVTCAGSTGGGIKMVRAQILYKQALRELLRIIHPRLYHPVKIAGQTIENNIVFAVLAFAFVYLSCISVLTLVLIATGMDVVSAFTAVVACINNVGPGLGQVGPASTYAGLGDFQTWVLSFTMLLGRLELFTLLVVLTPAFWRK